MTDYESTRKKIILEMLKKIVMETIPGDGSQESAVPGLFFTRRNEIEFSTKCFQKPMAALMVNRDKLMRVGVREIKFHAGDCFVNCVDIPTASTIADVSEQDPFIGVFFLLDKKILASLITEMQPTPVHSSCIEFAAPASLELAETFLRYVQLTGKPEQIQILAPLILRELHYLLLAGPQGTALRDIYASGASDNRILGAISWLKDHLKDSITVEELAKKMNMSLSTLHRHFKAITGFSPLQYHKQLRLYEAQRLMLAENERADMAAISVGYESITQFNREYKRLFGQPPRRDIINHKNRLKS